MMTIDEALEEAKRWEEYEIIWNSDSSEILSVVGVDLQADLADGETDAKSLDGCGVPVLSAGYSSAKLTREVLEKEQAERKRLKTRARFLNAWSAAPVEELLQILERGVYDSLKKTGTDSMFIVDHLWELHRDELTAVIRERLRPLVVSAVLGEEASRNLHAYLLALDSNEEQLAEIWRRERPGRTSYSDAFVLMDCFAHLRVGDSGIITDLIDMVETEWAFGPRYRAMMTLGKIGPRAGQRAADVIRVSIYDSSPRLVAERDRVLARIESRDEDWVRCENCCYGRVQSAKWHLTEPCAFCLGLGWQPV